MDGHSTMGAGDEEDYVTPEKSLRGIRARLFDDSAGDKTMEPHRRVKWDRGLYTLVYLDEVKLGSRQTLKENRILKGILAPTAKVCVSFDCLKYYLGQSGVCRHCSGGPCPRKPDSQEICLR